MLDSILQPINRKQFFFYSLVWFLCTGIIYFFLLTLNYKPSPDEAESLTSVLVQNWWFVQLIWLVEIVLYYKRIKDIMDAHYDEPNYYFLLIIPMVGFLITLDGPNYIIIPEFVEKILDGISNFLGMVLWIFLIFKKGKSSSS